MMSVNVSQSAIRFATGCDALTGNNKASSVPTQRGHTQPGARFVEKRPVSDPEDAVSPALVGTWSEISIFRYPPACCAATIRALGQPEHKSARLVKVTGQPANQGGEDCTFWQALLLTA